MGSIHFSKSSSWQSIGMYFCLLFLTRLKNAFLAFSIFSLMELINLPFLLNTIPRYLNLFTTLRAIPFTKMFGFRYYAPNIITLVLLVWMKSWFSLQYSIYVFRSYFIIIQPPKLIINVGFIALSVIPLNKGPLQETPKVANNVPMSPLKWESYTKNVKQYFYISEIEGLYPWDLNLQILPN